MPKDVHFSGLIRLYCKAYSMVFLDKIYAILLSFKYARTNNVLIDSSVINQVNSIGRSAFTDINDSGIYKNEKDLYRKTGCLKSQVSLHVEENYYLLLIKRYYGIQIYAFAAYQGKCRNIFSALLYIDKIAGNKKISCKARECTSYRLLKLFESRKKIIILKDEKIEMNSEPYHHVVFRIQKKNETEVLDHEHK